MIHDQKEAFKNDIVDCVNQHIKSSGLSPEEGTRVLLEMAEKALLTLSWLPQAKKVALTDIQRAIKWMNT